MNSPKRRLDDFAATPPRRLNTPGVGYTWFVRVARLALPLAAIVIIGIVVARLSLDPERENITDLPQDTKTSAGQIELEKARYEGTDTEGRAYTLTAEAASRDPDVPNVVLLTKPKADLTLTGGSWLAIESDTGIFNTKTAQLSLTGGVRLFHDSGNEMTLESVDIDTKAATATSSRSVAAQGPLGTLSAQSVDIQDGGDLIVFGGPATLSLRLPAKGNKG